MNEQSQKQSKENKTAQDITSRIQNAMNTGDYTAIAELITASVDKVLTQTKKGIKTGQYQMEKAIRAAKIQGANMSVFSKTKPEKPDPLSLPAPIAKTPAGTFSGPVMITGGVLTAIVGLGTLGAGLTGGFALVPSIAGGLVTLIGGFLIARGRGLMNRVKRFKNYVNTIRQRHVIETASLSETIGRPEKYIRKDVTKMIETGMFPEGHLTEDGKTLVLSNAAYIHYQNLQKHQKTLAQEAERKKKLEAENPNYKEVHQLMDLSNEALDQIHHLSQMISDPAMVMKLNHLTQVIRRILEQIQIDPSQVNVLRRFMNYYLPTTMKLLNAYEEILHQSVNGTNIMKTKTEIESALDTIGVAFEKLADSFYEDKAMDIASDISVMKTMMAREGLTEDSLQNQ